MENNQRNSKKRLNSLILLVAFTAVMLIVSTYAWFSAQKSVTISDIEGKVNVAEGLMVSLDAKNWSQEIDWDSPTLDSGFTKAMPYTNAVNVLPTELIPLSTTGTEYNTTELTTSGEKEVAFYNGINKGSELYSMDSVNFGSSDSGSLDFPGLFAIDLFLQNSSAIDSGETQGTSVETLQLNTNSALTLVDTGNYATGLQNTVRMALAMYTPATGSAAADTGNATASVLSTATQDQILAAYDGANIGSVAIWEPNAEDHVQYIVTNNNTLKLTSTLAGVYSNLTTDSGISKFELKDVVPTYALTSESLSAAETLNTKIEQVAQTGIKDVYNWNIKDDGTTSGSTANNGIDDVTGLAEQVALKTYSTTTTTGSGNNVTTTTDYTTYTGGVRNLIKTTSTAGKIYNVGSEAGAATFDMLQNTVVKCRLYIWLEGQDVDCINYASHGGGVHLDLGLVKGAQPGGYES